MVGAYQDTYSLGVYIAIKEFIADIDKQIVFQAFND